MSAWERCPDCGEYWCNVHEAHVHECDCPEIEVFDEAVPSLNPYINSTETVTAFLESIDGDAT